MHSIPYRSMILIGAILLTSFNLAASANESGRFTMSPTDGGFLRLDTASGVVSFCQRDQGEWACIVVSDDRGEQQRKIEALTSENQQLRRRLQELEEFADQSLKNFSEDPSNDTIQLPGKKDVDKVMSFVEHILQSIKEMAKRLNEDETSEMTL